MGSAILESNKCSVSIYDFDMRPRMHREILFSVIAMIVITNRCCILVLLVVVPGQLFVVVDADAA
jgi:hypothetical protein